MMNEHSTAMSELTTQGDPLAPRGALTCSVNMEALRGLSMLDLRNFRSVMNSLGDVLCGLASQPRFNHDDGYSPAGNLIDTLLEFVGSYEQAAVNVAVAAEVTTPDEVEDRAWTIIGFETDMVESLPEISLLTAHAVKDIERARFAERAS
nr:hypothetical protein RAR13_01300 [Aminobacter aminovorans]